MIKYLCSELKFVCNFLSVVSEKQRAVCPPSFINSLPSFAFVKLESSRKTGCTNIINQKLFFSDLHNLRCNLHTSKSLFENSNNDMCVELWSD